MAYNPTTMPGQLAAELVRAAMIREHYQECGREAGARVNVAPVIALMNFQIDETIRAIDTGDLAAQVRALAVLKENKS